MRASDIYSIICIRDSERNESEIMPAQPAIFDTKSATLSIIGNFAARAATFQPGFGFVNFRSESAII